MILEGTRGKIGDPICLRGPMALPEEMICRQDGTTTDLLLQLGHLRSGGERERRTPLLNHVFQFRHLVPRPVHTGAMRR